MLAVRLPAKRTDARREEKGYLDDLTIELELVDEDELVPCVKP